MAQPLSPNEIIYGQAWFDNLCNGGVIAKVQKKTSEGKRKKKNFLRDFFTLPRREDYIINDFVAFQGAITRVFCDGENFHEHVKMQPSLVVNLTKDTAHPFSCSLDFDCSGEADPDTYDLWDEERWAHCVETIANEMHAELHIPRDAFYRVGVVGGAFADKKGPGFHVHFPDVIVSTPEQPYRKYMPDSLVKLLGLAASEIMGFPVYLDMPSGLRVGRSDKWLSDEKRWRDDPPSVLFLRGGPLMEVVNPLKPHVQGMRNMVAPLREEAKKKKKKKLRRVLDMDDDEEEDTGISESDPRVRKAVHYYRACWDRDATVQSVRLGGNHIRVSMQDSPHNVCPHKGNNHWMKLTRESIKVYCYGSDENVRPRQVTWDFAATFEAIEVPVEEESDPMEVEDELLELLEGDGEINVGTPLLDFNFQFLRVDPPPYMQKPTGDALCISVQLFNHYRDLGADLGRLMSFAVNYCGSIEMYLVRNGAGIVKAMREKSVKTLLKRYVINVTDSKGKTRSHPFDFAGEDGVLQVGAMEHVAQRQLKDPLKLSVPVYSAVIPSFPAVAVTAEALIVQDWWRTLMHSLVSGSVPVRPRVDFNESLAQWLEDFALELLFGHQVIGLMPVLCEPKGGAGKSLFLLLLETILGPSQVEYVRRVADMQARRFNARAPITRLIAIDDANEKGANMHQMKGALTGRRVDVEQKFGGVDVEETKQCYVMIKNTFEGNTDAMPLTEDNRRLVIVTPGKNAPEIQGRLGIHQPDFGDTHASFLAYGYTQLVESKARVQMLCDYLFDRYALRRGAQHDLLTSLRTSVESGELATKPLNDLYVDTLTPVGSWLNDTLLGGRALLDESSANFTWPDNRKHDVRFPIHDVIERVEGVVENQTFMSTYARTALQTIYTVATGNRINAAQFNREFSTAFVNLSRLYAGDQALDDDDYLTTVRVNCFQSGPTFNAVQGRQDYTGLDVSDRGCNLTTQTMAWKLDFSAFALRYQNQ